MIYFKFLFNVSLFLSLFFSASVFAETSLQAKVSEYKDGDRQFIINEYTNELGEYEVTVALKEDWFLVPDTTHVVLVGRSLSNTKKVDVWFVPSEDGILKAVKNPKAVQTDSWQSAKWVMNHEMDAPERWFAWVALEYLGQNLSLAMSHDHEFYENIKREEMNLLDLEYRLDQIQAENSKDPILKNGFSSVLEGWKSLSEKIYSEKNQDIWFYSAGDVALIWIGGKLIQSVGKWLGALGVQFTEKYSLPQSELVATFQNLFERLKIKISEKTESVKNKIPFQQGTVRISAHENVVTWIQTLQTKSKIAHALIRTMSELLTTIKSGMKEAKYIALAQSLQILSEASARPEDLFDPNPIIMTNKMVQDKDFMQNFLYMTNETFWMAGISSRFSGSFAKRFAFCGILAAGDSAFMNLAIKGDVDSGRILLDSGWEIFVGNLQTQIDISALKYFEGLALKKANPKLKLLGYAVALVDQGAGYWGYAKASHYYEHNTHSAAKNNGLGAPAERVNKEQQVIQVQPDKQKITETFKIIPIMAELP